MAKMISKKLLRSVIEEIEQDGKVYVNPDLKI